MNTKLYVGNISFGTTDNDLRDAFTAYGTVTEVNLITDKMTGRSRGFAFVSMETADQAQAAIVVMAKEPAASGQIVISEGREEDELVY